MDANLRRKDTTRGPPLRILSLDGGGVRGYSMLIILQRLMYRVHVQTYGEPPKREEIPKPCDYFDLIAGTGTGGLIAIMLGRLRLDLETCMDVYVRMTRRVFETDKTIAGIPYKQTLFKASKLEDAIKACVREHTFFEDEGNDGTAAGGKEFAGMSPVSTSSAPRRSMSVRSGSAGGVSSPGAARNSSLFPATWGNADATLYDSRDKRTKTAVTAVYKDTPKNGNSILLRSYESRKEPSVEFDCTIWQAGRATSATGLAFKPIKIGQSTFTDEGSGKYNPSPQILEEAVVNEWPGRDLGVFVSIGTGKRPAGTNSNQHEWWEGFVGSSLGNFAEARRRLMTKIEGCEDTHLQMLSKELAKRGVPEENYFRLNVEVGVGEFGMNEWDRLGEMQTNTRRYLSKPEVEQIITDAATKMAKIELVKRRVEGLGHRDTSWNSSRVDQISATTSYSHPTAVELPADDAPAYSGKAPERRPGNPPYPVDHNDPLVEDKYMVVPGEVAQPRVSAELPYRPGKDSSSVTWTSRPSTSEQNGSSSGRGSPPPIPPKTPISGSQSSYSTRPAVNILPYPDTDGPPPIVNKTRKPDFAPR